MGLPLLADGCKTGSLPSISQKTLCHHVHRSSFSDYDDRKVCKHITYDLISPNTAVTTTVMLLTPFKLRSLQYYTPPSIIIYRNFPLSHDLVVAYVDRHRQPIVSPRLIMAYAGPHRQRIASPHLFTAYSGHHRQKIVSPHPATAYASHEPQPLVFAHLFIKFPGCSL